MTQLQTDSQLLPYCIIFSFFYTFFSTHQVTWDKLSLGLFFMYRWEQHACPRRAQFGFTIFFDRVSLLWIDLMHTLAGYQKTCLVYSVHSSFLIAHCLFVAHWHSISSPLLFSLDFFLFAILQCVRAKYKENSVSGVRCHIANECLYSWITPTDIQFVLLGLSDINLTFTEWKV